jgi:hypothetical protein
VWIRVALTDHRIDRVIVLEPAVPVMLQACITGELRGATFAHPIENEDTFPITF